MKKIECKYCGWGWNENEGGDDKYVCHMCGNDNARFYDNITEAEEPKKKLFRPIGLSGEGSRWFIWNKEQPIVDGVQINQYTHDGKKDGYWEYYYGDGKLEAKGSYKDNNKEGYWEEYYPNDQLSSKGSFINGKKDGYWETYWVNGKLHSKGSYVNGESDGYWENYYWPNGKLNWKGPYVNGKRDGVFEYYLKDGKLYRKELYKDGELAKRLPLTEAEEPKKKLFRPIGLSGEDSRWLKLNKEQPIVDGVQINQYTHDGKKDGYWEEHYGSGKLKGKGTYINGKRDGVWEEYWEKGPLFFKALYVNGKRDGYSEQYWWNGKLDAKGSYKDKNKEGYWEEYYFNGKLATKGSYKNGMMDGIWEFYTEKGKLDSKELYKDNELVKRLPLTESETPKKKLFRPIDLDKRYSDLLNTMITTEYYIGPYLQRRDSYIELKKELDPLIMELPNDKLILFVKANPFWLNSIEKVEYLLNKLNYKDNKDIADHHIGQSFAKGGFFATPELKYYEQKFKKPKSSYGKIDTYVFVGSDNFVETKKGSYKKVFDIERLMKVSLDDWKDTKDYGFGKMLKFMQLRAQANNKGLYKITANKGLLDDYEGKAGDEIPEYILSAIDQKKERI